VVVREVDALAAARHEQFIQENNQRQAMTRMLEEEYVAMSQHDLLRGGWA
jgi:hypothetical protein